VTGADRNKRLALWLGGVAVLVYAGYLLLRFLEAGT
jgi:hypothetical protein